MERLNFDKFVEVYPIANRFEYVAKQENGFGIRERIEKELAVMIDDLMMTSHNHENLGRQLIAIWQGYSIALDSMGVDLAKV